MYECGHLTEGIDLLVSFRPLLAPQQIDFHEKGQIGASFCALLAIDAGAILLGWAVLTHAFAAEVDGSELSVVEKVATCGVADDAEDDDDFVRKPPREEDGEVCLPVGIC